MVREMDLAGMCLRATFAETKPTSMEEMVLDHLLTMEKDRLYLWQDFAKEQGVDFGFVVAAVMKLIRKGVVTPRVVHNKEGFEVGVSMELNYDFELPEVGSWSRERQETEEVTDIVEFRLRRVGE